MGTLGHPAHDCCFYRERLLAPGGKVRKTRCGLGAPEPQNRGAQHSSTEPKEEGLAVCNHLDQVTVGPPHDVEGCEECLRTGDRWVHLRACRSCGKVGCCDSSPTATPPPTTKRPATQSSPPPSPTKDWSCCYVDEVAFVIERPDQ